MSRDRDFDAERDAAPGDSAASDSSAADTPEVHADDRTSDVDTQEIDAWDSAGAAVVSGNDLELGRSPAAAPADEEEPVGHPENVALALDPHSADDVTATDAEAKWNEEAERAATPRDRRRTLVLWGTRAAVGAVALAASVAVGFGAVWAMGPAAPAAEPVIESARFAPQSGTQQVVCPPGHVRVGAGGSLSGVGSSELSHVASADAEVTSLPVRGLDDAELTVLSAPSSAELVSGVQRVSASTDEVAGIALASCSAPAWSQWLVGGSTATGRQTTIVLANASEQAARVSLEVYGADGAVAATGGSQVVVEPGSASVLDLASLSVGNASPAVRVSSEGAPVVAFLQQSTIRGLEPGGIDVLEPTPAMSGVQTFVGVPLGEGYGHGSDETSDAGPVLRLVADGAEARVRLTFDSGSAEPIVTDVRVPATSVFELPLGELGRGTFAITIDSDDAVAAGVRIAPLDASDQSDFAWLAPARSLDTAATIEVPWLDRGPRLHVLNSTEQTQTYLIGNAERELAAGEMITVDDVPGELTLSGEGLRASVTYQERGTAAFTVQPSPAASASLAVEY